MNIIGLWLLTAGVGFAAATSHTEARLVLAAEAVRPGETVRAGVLLRMEPKWHTYWSNPGDSGMATAIQWELPEGITAGAVEWPVPERHDVEGLVTYILEDEALLQVPLTIAPGRAPGRVALKARVSWLECEVLCLPGGASVSAALEVGSVTRPSADAGLFERWQGRMPRRTGPEGLAARWDGPGSGDERALIVEWRGEGSAAEFLPLAGKNYEVGSELGRVPGAAGVARLRKTVKKSEGDWPAEVPGVLVERRQPALVAYQVVLKPGGGGSSGAAVTPGIGGPTPGTGEVGSGRPLVLMLAFAFLGGLILNVMPCVLPVIALKVLSFVRQAEASPRTVRRHGLLYGAGVLVSFLVLALGVVAVQWGGRLASWGMQFQSPGFLLGMTTLVLLVALNLFGVFEVTLHGGTMGAAAQLASREGPAGAFFNGVLATTLATPCTAPFLGSAVGFAFAQPAWVILLLFAVIGLGLAAPYVLMSFIPGLARYLPRPGVWMERFKVAMGFPMLGAAAWLFSLMVRHYGTDGALWVGMFLVGVSMAAWMWGQFVQRGRVGRGWAMAGSGLLLVASYGVLLEGQLDWRHPRATGAAGDLARKPGGIPWERWSPDAVERARVAGRPVLVDFTADWCVTCQANKKTSLEIPSVVRKLEAVGAVALLGDYTLRDDAITRELLRFGRAGVPLVLVYPKDPALSPQVLPELLTPSIVLEALEKAG